VAPSGLANKKKTPFGLGIYESNQNVCGIQLDHLKIDFIKLSGKSGACLRYSRMVSLLGYRCLAQHRCPISMYFYITLISSNVDKKSMPDTDVFFTSHHYY